LGKDKGLFNKIFLCWQLERFYWILSSWKLQDIHMWLVAYINLDWGYEVFWCQNLSEIRARKLALASVVQKWSVIQLVVLYKANRYNRFCVEGRVQATFCSQQHNSVGQDINIGYLCDLIFRKIVWNIRDIFAAFLNFALQGLNKRSVVKLVELKIVSSFIYRFIKKVTFE
jgi:hypothetical protein